jgi:hypothetical protein
MSWHWLSSEENSRVTLADEVAPKLRQYVLENQWSSLGSDLEVGGLLLGSIEQYCPLRVRIEDFEPIVCRNCGPYAPDEADHKPLEKAIKRPRAIGLEVIGFFRSYCGREPVLDPFDHELFTTYFPNRSDVLLILHPTSPADCLATFRFGDEFSEEPRHSFFAFYEGMSQSDETATVQKSPPILTPVPDSSQNENAVAVPELVRVPTSVPEADQNIEALPSPEPALLSNFGSQLTSKNRLPWLAAVASVLLLIPAYIWFTGSRQARSLIAVPKHIATQMIQPPVVPAATPISRPAPEARGPAPNTATPSPPARPMAVVPPEIRHSVQPKIPSGIRARITNPIVIPVRVRVSSAGHVVAAVLEAGDEKDGLHRYLRRVAAKSALAWSFDPAKTKEGTPIMAEREISFVFEPQ